MANDDLSVLNIDKSRISRRGKKKHFVYLLLLPAFLIIVGVLYYQGVLTLAVKVDVDRVVGLYPSEAYTLLNASGYVVAQRKAAVASKITARLVSLSVEEGSPVKAGQEIARLESDDLEAARNRALADLEFVRFKIEQVKAELTDATRSHQRNKQLLPKQYISMAEYDVGEARYRTARAALSAEEAALKASRAALREAVVNLEYAIIRAPFDALVLTKNADIGDIVTPVGAAADSKSAVVNIADMDSLMVEVDVSESNIRQVYVKQPCEIRLDALPEARFAGRVHMIVPTADRSKASVMVKIAFLEKDRKLLPEMSAKAAFLSQSLTVAEKEPVMAVPTAALIEAKGENIVFLVQDGKIIQKTVRLGRQLGDMTEVKSGLALDDVIALNPLHRLKQGMKVVISD
ncbi:MAG: efflux RND transporter periplasmic adaptor subunit [Desulfobacter postgatei]|uniref:efflux RND transporter periplasmic adaptor subunit n=1 Tax=Desulfobacter postgatei TaxID=2293 RepID=UPI0023F4642F|nr:efflux RND transporter periplasmic adaptor subunit [Desulfobacter postgatei]MDD4272106.1 efflux RND transporter periplasmic adaptor subunit [Desulfobacter postgatei]